MPRICSSRRLRFFSISFSLATSAFAAPLVAACGSRGPLDLDPINYEDASDAATDVEVDVYDAPIEATRDVQTDEASTSQTLVDCGLCLGQQCGTPILTCIQSTSCRATFQCAATKCFAMGAPDPKCFFSCAGGDPNALVPLLELFTCITSMCGSNCSSLIGQLGGIGGNRRKMVIRESFSRWPELCGEQQDGL